VNISTFAGINSEPGLINGKGIQSKFNSPYGLCFNPNNNCLFLCDYNNNVVRKLTLNGIFVFLWLLLNIVGEVSTFIHIPFNPTAIVVHHKTNDTFVTTAHTIVKITAAGLFGVSIILF
jgi:hypothetical protein